MSEPIAPDRKPWFGLSARLRWVVAWSVAGITMAISIGCALFVHFNSKRADWNEGHVLIDFGGQYLMGRMLVVGRGRELYHRKAHLEVLREAYPDYTHAPDQRPDAERLNDWLIPVYPECTIGGALYPPIHALFMAPFALLPPQPAFRIVQFLDHVWVLLIGWMAQRLSAGRLWMPVAIAVLFCFPGYIGAIVLGQNAVFSLMLLVSGWYLLSRGRPGWAGVVWGLLAFKPVWAAAFFLTPLLTGRWRMALTTALTGTILALLTLPFVGVQAWFDWLAVGGEATKGYTVVTNWIHLSRDLNDLPLRWMTVYEKEQTDPHWALAVRLGWVLWLSFAATSIGVVLWRVIYERRFGRGPALEGPAATFVLLGSYFSCFHFLFYDSLLAALPVMLLFMEPGRYARWPRSLGAALRWLWDEPAPSPRSHAPRGNVSSDALRPGTAAPGSEVFLPATQSVEELRSHAERGNEEARRPLPNVRAAPFWDEVPLFILVFNIIATYVGNLLNWSGHGPPWDTYGLLVLWAWCCVSWIRQAPTSPTPEPRVPSPPTDAAPPAPSPIHRRSDYSPGSPPAPASPRPPCR
jgi:hypothetical protein